MPVYSFTTFDEPLTNTGTTTAIGINDAGQIVGSYKDSGNIIHGYLLSGGTYTSLTDPFATTSTVATAINASGEIVGRFHNGAGNHGFLYNGGIYTTIDVPGGRFRRCRRVTADIINDTAARVRAEPSHTNSHAVHGNWRAHSVETSSPEALVPLTTLPANRIACRCAPARTFDRG